MQIGGLVECCNTGKIVAPGIQLSVRVRYGLDLVVGHNRVRLPGGSVAVKLFFEQLVDGLVDVEWWAGWPTNFKAHVEPKAAWTLHKQLDFGATHLKWLSLPRCIRR